MCVKWMASAGLCTDVLVTFLVTVFMAQKVKGAILIRVSLPRFPTQVYVVTTEEALLQTKAVRGGLHHLCHSVVPKELLKG